MSRYRNPNLPDDGLEPEFTNLAALVENIPREISYYASPDDDSDTTDVSIGPEYRD
jgi:hypothetical protein